ncbi:hypothetical protein O6H91_Y565400 [Diphasiastrum complanatum]|nr:hypothetical protein O6H91_Y565400 [Diphasiastrum complanatum]
MASDKNLNLNLVPKISIHFTILYNTFHSRHVFVHNSMRPPSLFALPFHTTFIGICIASSQKKRTESTPSPSTFAAALHKRMEYIASPQKKRTKCTPSPSAFAAALHKERNPHIIQRFQLLWFVFEREGRFTSASFCWAPAPQAPHRHHRQQVDA